MDYLDGLLDGQKGVFVPFVFINITSSHTQALLLSQICYYAKANKWEQFYKFKMPCEHPMYKEGDSWSELLNMTEYEIDTALKAICQKVKSGEQLDPNAFVWTKRTQDNRTYYKVNRELISQIMVSGSGTPKKSDSGVLPIREPQKNPTPEPQKSPVREPQKNGVRIYTDSYTENNTNITHKGSDGLGFTDNGNNEVKGYESVTFKSEEKQSIPPSSAAPPLNYGSRIPKYGQLSLDYFEVQELLKVHPDAVLDLTPSTKHTFEELGKTYGIEKVKEVAKWLGESRASQYLPKIINFIQTEQFAGDLNSMITAKQFAPPKAPSQKTPQHPLTKGPQPKLII